MILFKSLMLDKELYFEYIKATCSSQYDLLNLSTVPAKGIFEEKMLFNYNSVVSLASFSDIDFGLRCAKERKTSQLKNSESVIREK